MAEESGKPAGGEPMIGTQPTGAALPSAGSSVETEEDIATAESIPDVEEIVGTERDRES